MDEAGNHTLRMNTIFLIKKKLMFVGDEQYDSQGFSIKPATVLRRESFSNDEIWSVLMGTLRAHFKDSKQSKLFLIAVKSRQDEVSAKDMIDKHFTSSVNTICLGSHADLFAFRDACNRLRVICTSNMSTSIISNENVLDESSTNEFFPNFQQHRIGIVSSVAISYIFALGLISISEIDLIFFDDISPANNNHPYLTVMDYFYTRLIAKDFVDLADLSMGSPIRTRLPRIVGTLDWPLVCKGESFELKMTRYGKINQVYRVFHSKITPFSKTIGHLQSFSDRTTGHELHWMREDEYLDCIQKSGNEIFATIFPMMVVKIDEKNDPGIYFEDIIKMYSRRFDDLALENPRLAYDDLTIFFLTDCQTLDQIDELTNSFSKNISKFMVFGSFDRIRDVELRPDLIILYKYTPNERLTCDLRHYSNMKISVIILCGENDEAIVSSQYLSFMVYTDPSGISNRHILDQLRHTAYTEQKSILSTISSGIMKAGAAINASRASPHFLSTVSDKPTFIIYTLSTGLLFNVSSLIRNIQRACLDSIATYVSVNKSRDALSPITLNFPLDSADKQPYTSSNVVEHHEVSMNFEGSQKLSCAILKHSNTINNTKDINAMYFNCKEKTDESDLSADQNLKVSSNTQQESLDSIVNGLIQSCLTDLDLDELELVVERGLSLFKLDYFGAFIKSLTIPIKRIDDRGVELDSNTSFFLTRLALPTSISVLCNIPTPVKNSDYESDDNSDVSDSSKLIKLSLRVQSSPLFSRHSSSSAASTLALRIMHENGILDDNFLPVPSVCWSRLINWLISPEYINLEIPNLMNKYGSSECETSWIKEVVPMEFQLNHKWSSILSETDLNELKINDSKNLKDDKVCKSEDDSFYVYAFEYDTLMPTNGEAAPPSFSTVAQILDVDFFSSVRSHRTIGIILKTSLPEDMHNTQIALPSQSKITGRLVFAGKQFFSKEQLQDLVDFQLFFHGILNIRSNTDNFQRSFSEKELNSFDYFYNGSFNGNDEKHQMNDIAAEESDLEVAAKGNGAFDIPIQKRSVYLASLMIFHDVKNCDLTTLEVDSLSKLSLDIDFIDSKFRKVYSAWNDEVLSNGWDGIDTIRKPSIDHSKKGQWLIDWSTIRDCIAQQNYVCLDTVLNQFGQAASKVTDSLDIVTDKGEVSNIDIVGYALSRLVTFAPHNGLFYKVIEVRPDLDPSFPFTCKALPSVTTVAEYMEQRFGLILNSTENLQVKKTLNLNIHNLGLDLLEKFDKKNRTPEALAAGLVETRRLDNFLSLSSWVRGREKKRVFSGSLAPIKNEKDPQDSGIDEKDTISVSIPQFLQVVPIPMAMVRVMHLFPRLVWDLEHQLLCMQFLRDQIPPSLSDINPPVKYLASALTSASAGVGYDYERMEILGDSLLKILTTIDVYSCNAVVECREIIREFQSSDIDNDEVLYKNRLIEFLEQRYSLKSIIEEGQGHTLEEGILSNIRQKRICNYNLYEVAVKQLNLPYYGRLTRFLPKLWCPPDLRYNSSLKTQDIGQNRPLLNHEIEKSNFKKINGLGTDESIISGRDELMLSKGDECTQRDSGLRWAKCRQLFDGGLYRWKTVDEIDKRASFRGTLHHLSAKKDCFGLPSLHKTDTLANNPLQMRHRIRRNIVTTDRSSVDLSKIDKELPVIMRYGTAIAPKTIADIMEAVICAFYFGPRGVMGAAHLMTHVGLLTADVFDDISKMSQICSLATSFAVNTNLKSTIISHISSFQDLSSQELEGLLVKTDLSDTLVSTNKNFEFDQRPSNRVNLEHESNLNWSTVISSNLNMVERPNLTPYWQFPFEKVESLLGNRRFKNRDLLFAAFTHSSASHDRGGDYERIEWLGDAILDWAVMRYYWHSYPDDGWMNPGRLTIARQAAVSNDSFAVLAVVCGFHDLLRIASSNLQIDIMTYAGSIQRHCNIHDENTGLCYPDFSSLASGDFANEEIINFSGGNSGVKIPPAPKVLGDLFEAVAGALLIDIGLDIDRCLEIILPLIKPYLKLNVDPYDLPSNPLQELWHDIRKSDISGRVLFSFGTVSLDEDCEDKVSVDGGSASNSNQKDECKRLKVAGISQKMLVTCTIRIDGVQIGTGRGTNRLVAKMDASDNALQFLRSGGWKSFS